MNIQPLHDYYLIKLLEPEEKTTDAGIVLPEAVQKKLSTVIGEVVRNPKRGYASQEPERALEGVTVIVKPDASIMYEAVDMGDDGQFFLVKYENIIAVLDEEEESK